MGYDTTLRLRTKCDLSLNTLAEIANKCVSKTLKQLEDDWQKDINEGIDDYDEYTENYYHNQINSFKQQLNSLQYPNNEEYVEVVSGILYENYDIECDGNEWYYVQRKDLYVHTEIDNIDMKNLPRFTSYEQFEQFVKDNRESERNNTKNISDYTLEMLKDYWILYPYSVLDIW